MQTLLNATKGFENGKAFSVTLSGRQRWILTEKMSVIIVCPERRVAAYMKGGEEYDKNS